MKLYPRKSLQMEVRGGHKRGSLALKANPEAEEAGEVHLSTSNNNSQRFRPFSF